jgi:hypothetical protein
VAIQAWAFGAALAAGIFVYARDAAAFCRTTTVSVPPDFTPNGGVCWTQGHPLYWANACVGYSLYRGASKYITYEEASTAFTRAFSKWTGTVCPTGGGAASRVSIDVRDEGPVDCNEVIYNQDAPNNHAIIFRDDSWPHNDSNNTLALTTVTFNPMTGEIYDADMEVNTAQQVLTAIDPIPTNGYDLASIITHESGHFLGLAHSGDMHATMFAHYTPGSTAMRNLTTDDVSGICAIYHPDGNRMLDTGPLREEACDPTPRHGFSTVCTDTTKPTTGCSVAHEPADVPWEAGLVLGLGVVLRRKKDRRRSPSR